MKQIVLAAALTATALTAAAQPAPKALAFYPRPVTEPAAYPVRREPDFMVLPVSNRPVTASSLTRARRISDLVEHYPEQWITKYVSTNVTVTRDGRTLSAGGENEVLTKKQVELLASAGLSDDLAIAIAYLYRNPITGHPDQYTMNLQFTVVPHRQAEFPGGQTQMIRSLKAFAMSRIMEDVPAADRFGTVRFTVDANGRIVNARVVKTSGNAAMERILLDAVNHMPDWKPAKEAGGRAVKQDFELRVNEFGGC
jgi:TonB family protein